MNFKSFLIFLLLFNGSMLYSNELHNDSIACSNVDYRTYKKNSIDYAPKSPKAALLRSCVLPGWGIAYAHDRKGIIAVSEIAGATVLSISPIVNGINFREERGDFTAGLFIAAGLAVYVYQIVYSYNAAIDYNERYYYRMFSSNIAVNFTPDKKGFLLQIALKL